jgi:hypothetical protein
MNLRRIVGFVFMSLVSTFIAMAIINRVDFLRRIALNIKAAA